jgi:hypothetical protein
MSIGISYWSKGDHEELAVHRFNAAGDIESVAQYERTGKKSACTGNAELLAEGLAELAKVNERCQQPEPTASSV